MSLGKVATTETREAVFVKQGLADTTFRMSVARPGGPRSVAAVESPPQLLWFMLYYPHVKTN